MPLEPEKDLEAKLSRIAQELGHVKDALRTLGLKQCASCGKYYPAQDGKSLFDADHQLICSRCVPDWWRRRSPSLPAEQRQGLEHKLRRWFVTHHNAKVIQQADKLPPPEKIELKLVVACEQCNGSGKSAGGGECRSCDGRGSVWVVRLYPELQ
jgi:hypothetical protein